MTDRFEALDLGPMQVFLETLHGVERVHDLHVKDSIMFGVCK